MSAACGDWNRGKERYVWNLPLRSLGAEEGFWLMRCLIHGQERSSLAEFRLLVIYIYCGQLPGEK